MPEASDKTKALLTALWERNRPVLLERLDVLERAAVEPLTPELKTEAAAVAHKLAGSLGMFGYAEGTRLSQELEVMLEADAVDQQQVRTLVRQLRFVLFPEG